MYKANFDTIEEATMPVNDKSSDKFKTPTERLNRDLFPHQKRPHWCHLDKGIALGYRTSEPRPGQRGAGKWVARIHGKESPLGTADDREEANGVEVKTFAQARAACLGEVRTDVTGPRKTLQEAMEEYAENMDGDPRNITTPLTHLRQHAKHLLSRDVNALTVEELQAFRTALKKANMTVSTYNRMRKGIVSALKRAVPKKPELWQQGLETRKDKRTRQQKARNVVLDPQEVTSLVLAAYRHSQWLGLIIDVLRWTGARASQAARLVVDDVHIANGKAWLMMPPSFKGGGDVAEKKPVHVPIPVPLAQALRAAAKGRAPSDYLLLTGDGKAWADYGKQLFYAYGRELAEVLASIDLTHKDGRKVTSYALRHTSITRMILTRLVPLPVIAELHDTSEGEIRKHYAAAILDHAEDMVRAAMFGAGNAGGPPLQEVTAA